MPFFVKKSGRGSEHGRGAVSGGDRGVSRGRGGISRGNTGASRGRGGFSQDGRGYTRGRGAATRGRAEGDGGRGVKRKMSLLDQTTARIAREEIESSEDEEELQHVKKRREEDDDEEQDEADVETAEEKTERLAKQYLQELEDQRRLSRDEEDADAENLRPLHQQLREEVQESAGKLFRAAAHNYASAATCHTTRTFRCKRYQRKTVTCLAINHKDNTVFSGSLDGSIIKYNLAGEVVGVLRSFHQQPPPQQGAAHKKEVHAIAVSSDGKFMVSGDSSGVIHAWSADTLEHLETLKKHRGAVMGLVFQRNSHNLYSCSKDRLVMAWCLDTMAFVENLGGHASAVLGVDALHRESCISCGGCDETVIVYAILDDKQFQYSGKQGSIDGVKLINEGSFITYGQDGSLSLWSTTRKRPLQQLKAAHGSRSDGAQEPHWITAITALVNTDLVASGSSDGFVRLWRVDGHGSKLYQLARVAVPPGFVNSLEFTADGCCLLAAVSRTNKLGRWYVEKKAKNCLICITFTNIKHKPKVKHNVDETVNGNGADTDSVSQASNKFLNGNIVDSESEKEDSANNSAIKIDEDSEQEDNDSDKDEENEENKRVDNIAETENVDEDKFCEKDGGESDDDDDDDDDRQSEQEDVSTSEDVNSDQSDNFYDD